MIERLVIRPETWPKEIAPVLMEHAERCAWLIPAWCVEVHLRYQNANPQSSTAIARTSVNYEYRAAYVTVFSSWFDGDEHQRRKNLAHEFCHIINAPLADYVTDLIPKIVPDPAFQAVILEEHAKRVESITEDMATMVIEMEDQLGSQIGAENLAKHMRIILRHSQAKIRRNVHLQPTSVPSSASDRKTDMQRRKKVS